MYKLVIVVPYAEMVPMAQEAFEEHTRYEIEKGLAFEEEYQCKVISHKGYSEEIMKELEGADVVIARGVMYQILSRTIGSRVVELLISSYDLIVLFNEIKNTLGNKKIGAIGSTNMIKDAEEIGRILGLTVKSYVVNEIITQEPIDHAIKEGCEVIIGSNKSCYFAQQRNVHNFMIRTGKQSIVQAIADAKQIAKVKREEQEKTLYLKAVLDYSSEGILSVDSEGNIKSINKSAERILKIHSCEVMGKPFSILPFPLKLQKWMMDKRTYLNEIIQYKSFQLSLNKIPMVYNDGNIGNIATFQDITRLQELEGIIRNKIYLSGHVAKYSFESILHQSSIIKEKIILAKQYARTDLSVMITGESGTGKEMFAQSIHQFSNRKDRPFVAINCAALPESLLESELFGYVEGAFTGAAKGGKAGLFEIAHKGTIFLDEVSELPQRLQGRLLRVLQEGEIMRLGHDKVTSIDVRVIAATNKNLQKLVQKGEFREDIYFRLNVLRLNVPPLRERKEDLPLLVNKFFAQMTEKMGIEPVTIEHGVLPILQLYNWPGNIRELMNVCDRLVVIARNNLVRKEDVYSVLEDEYDFDRVDNFDTRENFTEKTNASLKREVDMLEKTRIQEAMDMFGGNKVKAAQHLGWSRTTLWRKIKAIEEQGRI